MDTYDVFSDACRFDKTLHFSKEDLVHLKRKELRPVAFDHRSLFDAMNNGRTILFNDYPVRDHLPQGADKRTFNLELLRKNLDQGERIFIRYGRKRTLRKVSINDMVGRWERARSRFGVTDLHFRGTPYYRKVDAHAISYFNLLPGFREDVSFLEMLTLVVSSRGIFSDSHSDDGDGSNHCILGKKLWLAWDYREGKQAGLEDCTYDPVFSQAKFSMSRFLSLRSSHWFVVSDGRTLFMPGNFTHKVITLEPYIGYGSFYLAFPNYIASMKRWILSHSSDVTPAYISSLNGQFEKLVKKCLLSVPDDQLQQMGFGYFQKDLSNWAKGLGSREKEIFRSKANIDGLASMVGMDHSLKV